MTNHVAIYCRDKPDMGPLRQMVRPAHLDWIRESPFPVSLAGPLLAQDGETMIGSLIVVQAGDLQAVRDWAERDPYAVAGLFKQVTIRPWRHLLGEGLPRGPSEVSAG